MSVRPREKTDSTTGKISGFGSVIDQIRGVNENTDPLSDNVGKTAKDIALIAKILKKYITSEDKTKDKSSTDGLKTNKICKVYGCIYKGTYDGIIDGLKKVSKDDKAEQLRAQRMDTAGNVLRSTAKAAMKAPVEITRAIVNLVAWERSEFLNLMRGVFHGVGVGKDAGLLYQKKAYRLMLEQEHDRKKLLKRGNVYTQNETIIDLLERISYASEEQILRERKFGLSRIFGKKESAQVELLRKINEELIQIEDNTGGGSVGMFGTKATMIRWLPILTPLAAGLFATLGSGISLGGVAGIGAMAPLFGKEIATGISGGLSGISDFLLDPVVLGTAIVGGFVAKGLFTAKRSVADKQAIVQEDQLKVLTEIRDAVAGEEEKKKGLGASFAKFTDFSLKNFLFGQKKKFKSTAVDLTNEKLDSILIELEHNTNYQDDILHEINKNLMLNRMKASDGRKLLNKIDEIVKLSTLSSPIITPYEADSLKYFQGIEQANIDELNAIGILGEKLCSCLIMDKDDDGIYKSMEATRQHNLEQGMDDQEERKETISRSQTLQETVQGIYDLMIIQNNNLPEEVKQKGMLSKALGAVIGSTDTIGDAANIKEAFFDTTQKVKWNTKQVVSLSDATLDRLCKCIESIDDDMDLPGKRRRKRRSRIPKIEKPDVKIKTSLKDRIKGIKGKAGKGLGKGKGLLLKGGSLAASTVPIMSGGLGIGGLLTGTGATIAGAGAGALAGAGGLLAAAGAAGYGLGTLLNKGLDKAVTAGTGGGSTSLGDMFYNLTHGAGFGKKPAKPVIKQDLNKPLNIDKMKKDQKDLNKKYVDKFVNEERLDKNSEKQLKKTNKILEKAKPSIVVASGLVDASVPLANEIADTSITIADKLTTGSLLLAKDIIEKASSVKWQESLARGWQSSVTKIDELAESIDVLDAIKESQTVGAVKQVVHDAKSFVAGGNSTTNINVPISAHDTDRQTNLLVDSLGS